MLVTAKTKLKREIPVNGRKIRFIFLNNGESCPLKLCNIEILSAKASHTSACVFRRQGFNMFKIPLLLKSNI